MCEHMSDHVAMTAFFIFMGAVAAVDLLALKFGSDSRRLHHGRSI